MLKDTSTNWLKVNPVIPKDVLTNEIDTGITKRGDGVTKYSKLPSIGYEDKVSLDKLSADNANLESAFSEAGLLSKQDWYEVFQKLKVKNNNDLLYQKVDDNNINIYIHHFGNVYQQWALTRNTGLDNAVSDHANGNAWQINTVKNVRVGDRSYVNYDDVGLTKSGTWQTYDPIIRGSGEGSYVEATVTGSDIFLYGTWKNDGGIATLTIDGVDVGTVDFYDASTGGRTITKKIAGGLSNTAHTVRITITANKNELSTGYIVRFGSFTGIGNVNLSDLSSTGEGFEEMPSTRNYRYGLSAIEIAVNTTYNGSTVWSGTYHKYLYPVVSDNQKIYIDGIETALASLTAGTYYTAKDIMITQALVLTNSNADDLANVNLIGHFTSDGYHVKWNLEWLVDLTVNSSYSAMFGTSVDKLIFGDTQTVVTAVQDNAEKGSYPTHNFIGWQSQDGYIVAYKSLNPVAMAYDYRNMYFRDRATDAKVYVPRYSGAVTTGDKWQSEFMVSIAKCNDVSLIAS